ncbi:MAG: glycosyltransferase family 39 protein, partial [Candidatus Marinimicrobia bacterium]|nr:glycosyltransferase family 39 protein [Candidatus Neomarinimicrobiota bacterium]
MSIKNTLIYPIIFAIAQIIFVLCICGVQVFPDTASYISAADFIMTGSGEAHPTELNRLLRPLGPILSIVFTPFVGNVANGFIAENCMFLILSSVLVSLIAKEIYNNEKVALFSSILFSSSWVVLYHGLTILTEMGAFFFIILSIYLTLIFFKKDRNYKFLLIIGLTCGLGILMKENAVMGALFFVLMLLLSKNGTKRKIDKLLVFSFAFLIPILINTTIMYYLFNYTYLDWYLYNVGRWAASRNFIYLIYELGFIFNIIFPFFIIGLYNQVKNKENLKMYTSLIISSFIPVLSWPAMNSSRLVFVVFIGMIPLASYGVKLLCDYFDTSVSKIATKIIEIGIIST